MKQSDTKKNINTRKINAINELECVILEWDSVHYLLPLIVLKGAHYFHRQYFSCNTENKKALGNYQWENENYSVYSLSNKKTEVQDTKYMKIAFIHDNKSKMAVLFQNEAKQVAVKENELTWLDASKNLAELKQQRIIDQVVVFRRSCFDL